MRIKKDMPVLSLSRLNALIGLNRVGKSTLLQTIYRKKYTLSYGFSQYAF